ncbi:hypothetical protein CCHL11_04997 [Colletotrichum chlorophyti]|uniref:DNA replication regulator Sld3 C-terminal domain-containing protein n=1 Tax=Colletotrichum chlorophyti TaxID=708187 RepID=A0A1Q8S3B4_9PEZI|nr:hypothetical protein CCHL11_04997 [Colletotrichum chlorophyti]
MSSYRQFPPSDASRPRSGILTPTSDGSLNSKHEALPPSHAAGTAQRKRSSSRAMGDLLNPAIVVKVGLLPQHQNIVSRRQLYLCSHLLTVAQAHPPRIQAKPCTLQPLMLLPREDLSLSCLDLAAPHGDLPSSRLYESHIKILDLEDRVAEKPSLLLARNDASKVLYVIERAVAPGSKLYTVCKLGAWVDLLALSAKATVTGKHIARLRLAEESRESQQHQELPLTTPALHMGNKEKRLAIEALQQSIVRKRGRSQSVSTFDETRAEKRTRSDDDASRPQTPSGLNPNKFVEPKPEPTEWMETHLDAVEPTPQPAPETSGQQTSGDIMENIRTQYMEALYKSMGSLAYFAKGPLSRARAAFHLDCDGNMNMNDLIDFLKSLVMTTVQIDKKYRETIPDVISKLKTYVDSSDDGSKPRKRKTKKMKLGKDGMYPGEDGLVRSWWNSSKPELSDEDAALTPSQIKSHVSLLRTRETQLQMILILEILALEPLRAAEGETESQLPGLPAEKEAEKAPEAQPKKRSKHNFPVLVDVHADRLCIWQSTASDEMKMLEDSQVSTSVGGEPAQKLSADPLKDFCTDVIMPFFASRLPDISDSISRKLGGPVIIAPPKPKTKSSSSKSDARPGGATKRPSAAKSTVKNLEKALFKEQSRRSVSRGPSNAIALLRSATSANIAGFKREGGDAERKSSVDRTGMLSRSSSMTALDDAKAQKKALLEAELKDAITALRKPNRELAVKPVVEAAEKRTSGGLSSIKKSKKPTRHPLFDAVQVKVTPANNRFRDAFAADSQGASSIPIPLSSVPPSSASRIPSTGPRRGHIDILGSTPSAIQATPVKRGAPSNALSPADEPAFPPSSPLMARKPAKTQHLSAPGSVIREPEPMRSPSPDVGLPATPCKQRTANMLGEEVAATPLAKTAPPPQEKPKSIYARLGWDDDFDDL